MRGINMIFRQSKRVSYLIAGVGEYSREKELCHCFSYFDKDGVNRSQLVVIDCKEDAIDEDFM